MAEQEEYHGEFDDSSDEDEENENEGEGEGTIDITDIKSTPSKALRPATFKDRVFIIHAGDMTRIENMKILTLPHPAKGIDAKYILYNKKILEIQRMIDEPSSWFIDSNVEKDGLLYMATPIDPLFLALPVLEKSRRKTADHQGYFSDNILAGDTWQEILSSVTVDLTQVCDSKTIGDDICVYRLNDDLTTKWLQKKLVRLVNQITGDTAIVATGTATASTFVRARAARAPTLAETFNAALGFLAEYVTADWISILRVAYEKQIPKDVPQTPDLKNIHPVSDRSVFDDDDFDENPRDAKRVKKNPTTPTPKTGAKANKLAAAAKGSAVISSFFQKKK